MLYLSIHRVRNEETLFILRQLLFLEMRPNLLNQEGDGKQLSRRALCWILQLFLIFQTFSIPFHSTDDIKKLLLGSSRAQIFYLYPTLCKTMVSQDAAVVALIGELLEVAGQAMGLCPKDTNK